MLPAIRFHAQRHGRALRAAAAVRTWEGFVEAPGQEHWRCPCGTGDAARERQTLQELA